MDFKSFRMMERIDANFETKPLKISKFYMLDNGYEIFEILIDPEEQEEEPVDDGTIIDTKQHSMYPNIFTLTVGEYVEFGFHNLNEMKKRIHYETTDLHNVMPAPGWRWVGVH